MFWKTFLACYIKKKKSFFVYSLLYHFFFVILQLQKLEKNEENISTITQKES